MGVLKYRTLVCEHVETGGSDGICLHRKFVSIATNDFESIFDNT